MTIAQDLLRNLAFHCREVENLFRLILHRGDCLALNVILVQSEFLVSVEDFLKISPHPAPIHYLNAVVLTISRYFE